MFHARIDIAAATAEPYFGVAPDRPPLDTAAKLWSLAIVAVLPLILVGLLFNWLWSDIKKFGRAVGHFHRGAAEELSRPS
ncbi:MAG: hypothetical protein ABIS38_02710 [Sphingomicrobium sp.]